MRYGPSLLFVIRARFTEINLNLTCVIMLVLDHSFKFVEPILHVVKEQPLHMRRARIWHIDNECEN